MTTDPALADFATQLEERVQEKISDNPELMFRDAFVDLVSEYLIEDGALDDLTVCHLRMTWQSRTVEVAGYDITDADSILHLVVTIDGIPGEGLKRDRIDRALRQASAFVDFSRNGNHETMARSNPAYDMVQKIHAKWSSLHQIRVIVLTDGVATIRRMKDWEFGGLPTGVHIWDLPRLRKLMGTHVAQDDIVIEFDEMGYELGCFESPPQSDGYRCLMTVLPGELLAELYEEHHSRLLQRNVRAFLQARGKVNKGIAETIRDTPGRFLAYNNGVSATARSAELGKGADGAVLRQLTELQIVNGGQTTASLHHAWRRGIPLKGVYVPAKITLLDNERLDGMIPEISKYANSQNAVTASDFEGNSAFHVGLERHSRISWTSGGSDGTQTRWYYERVRGQYDVDRARVPAGVKRRQFDAENPKSQKFGKLEAARYQYAADMKPDVVCLGAQKNFIRWTEDFHLDKCEAPGSDYFRNLVAKAITFAQVRKIIMGLKLGAYPGQLTAYVVSLLADRLVTVDWNSIWRLQRLPPELEVEVPQLARVVSGVVFAAPGAGNIGEWCKKEECWSRVRSLDWEPSADLRRVMTR
ncbi:AIPR family protein [Amycolatopsis japonica]|uniref:AIPR family protein n=1 Tax=Amycolatopsis japonica TaxID=208439 RepID=UPI0033D3EFA7